MNGRTPALAFAAVAAVALAGCAAPGGDAQTPFASARAVRPATCNGTVKCIKHVVVIVQENRSLDNIFGDPNGHLMGLRRHTSGIANCPSILEKPHIVLQPIKLEYPHDINHSWGSSLKSFDGGTMDGFCYDAFYYDPPTLPYAYVPDTPDEAGPYWEMAQQYVVADEMFPTEFGASFTGHLTLIAGNDDLVPGNNALVDLPSNEPWGCDAPPSTVSPYIHYNGVNRLYESAGPFPCLTEFKTMADTLDAAGVSWKYYAPCVTPVGKCDPGGPLWSAFDAIENVRHGADWSKVVSPPSTILKDARCASHTCTFPNVAWVVPDVRNSDHAETRPDNSNKGPSWVASVVNAIHHNSALWQSTAIVVVWDDYGGWSDLAVPPQSPRFGGTFVQGDFRGLGIRVPCLIISPFTYGLKSHVVHTQYEFGSILKFIEETFDLPVLGTLQDGYTDGRATSLSNAFDFSLDPRRGADITAPYGPDTFLNQTPSAIPPDNE
ncbi:MAG: alkaline phosphatase family protein [Candidatus Tumulicola sp.]